MKLGEYWTAGSSRGAVWRTRPQCSECSINVINVQQQQLTFRVTRTSCRYINHCRLVDRVSVRLSVPSTDSSDGVCSKYRSSAGAQQQMRVALCRDQTEDAQHCTLVLVASTGKQALLHRYDVRLSVCLYRLLFQTLSKKRRAFKTATKRYQNHIHLANEKSFGHQFFIIADEI